MSVVLQVTEALGGGVLWSVSQTCNGLARAGWQVHLAYSERSETPADLTSYFDPAVVLHPLKMIRPIKPAADLKSVVALRNLFQKIQPDIIHLHSSKAGAIGRVAAWSKGMSARTVYSPRGLAFLREDVSLGEKNIYLAAERLGALFGGTVLACSRSELDIVRSRIRPKSSELIENAIEVDNVPVKKQFSTIPMIGSSGRLSFQKAPSAFAKLAAGMRDLQLDWMWIGGGDDQWADELTRSGVNVTGWLANAEARTALPTVDIYVQTSLWEGMPISVIEAQVCGIPAVVTDVVGNRDVVEHGVTGFVAKNAVEMDHYVRQLVKDGALRSAMGKASRERAYRRFSLSRMVAELVALYNQKMVED